MTPRAPDKDQIDALHRIANVLAQSGLGPTNNKYQAAAIVHLGHAMGLEPAAALMNIFIVEGRPCMSAHLMLALARRAGVRIAVKANSDKVCSVEFRRGEELHEVTWTIEQAQAIGLYPGKPHSAWRNYPRAMLWARAIAEGVRHIASDTLMFGAGGIMYVPEEVTEAVDADGRPDATASAPSRSEVVREIVAKAADGDATAAAPEPSEDRAPCEICDTSVADGDDGICRACREHVESQQDV